MYYHNRYDASPCESVSICITSM